MLSIILWMLGFAIIHSLMADKRLKDWLSQRIGERAFYGFYRLTYNLISLALLAPITLVFLSGGTVIWSMNGIWMIVFLIIQGIGLIGAAVSLLQIDALRFVGIRQVLAYVEGDSLPLPDESLKTDGLYGVVRHPLYFFSLLLIWFSPLMTTHLLIFNLCVTAYFVVGSRIEEWRMVQYYGDTYRAYQENVPWLLPNVKKALSFTSSR